MILLFRAPWSERMQVGDSDCPHRAQFQWDVVDLSRTCASTRGKYRGVLTADDATKG